MSTIKRDPPRYITVPVPYEMVSIGGIYTTYEQGKWLNVRCSQLEKEVIAQAAGYCRVTSSIFIRWVALSAARRVINHVTGKGRTTNDNNTNHET